MNSTMKFLRGLGVPFKGFFLVIKSFKHFMLAVIPVWICLGFAVYAALWAWNNSVRIVPFFMEWVPGMQTFTDSLKIGEFSLFGAIAQGLFWVFSIIFLSYFSYILLTIVGALFYSLLANSILSQKGLKPPAANNILHWLYVTLKMIMISLMKLAFFVCVAALLFVFTFLPAGMLLVPLGMCLMIAYDCLDFSFECMTFSVKSRFAFFKTHFPAFAGLALVILFVGSIPGLFTLTLPLFIAGGADLFADLQQADTPALILDPRSVGGIT